MSYRQIEASCRDQLEWLFCYSDAETGIRSNFGMIESGFSESATNYRENFVLNYISAISRKRTIENRFNKLSESDQYVLYSMYGWQEFFSTMADLDPVKRRLIRQHYGSLAPVVIAMRRFTDYKSSKEFYDDIECNVVKYTEMASTSYRNAVINYYRSK